MARLWTYSWILVAPMIAGSCAKGEDSDAELCPHDPPLEWENFGEPFMDQFCNGCHSSLVPEESRNDAPLGVDFDTYHGVLEYRYQIRAQCDPEAPAMPPGGGPNAEQYAQLVEWFDCKVDPDGEALGIP